MTRATTQRQDNPPRISPLRDSGELEQVADTIIMFHYPENDKHEPERTCDAHIVKQRNGPTGVASLRFLQEQTRFEGA
jgi:replicative DNA helicase